MTPNSKEKGIQQFCWMNLFGNKKSETAKSLLVCKAVLHVFNMEECRTDPDGNVADKINDYRLVYDRVQNPAYRHSYIYDKRSAHAGLCRFE